MCNTKGALFTAAISDTAALAIDGATHAIITDVTETTRSLDCSNVGLTGEQPADSAVIGAGASSVIYIFLILTRLVL